MNASRVAGWAYLVFAVAGVLFRYWAAQKEAVKDDDAFSVMVFSDADPEEDLATVIALKEFFDNNTMSLGNDGWTEWVVE